MQQSNRIGLVLSGGGSKGAYQAGVYKAMKEMGLLPRIKAIAGTSIGSFNAVLFACGTVDPVTLWENMTFSHLLSYADPKSPLLALAAQFKNKLFHPSADPLAPAGQSAAEEDSRGFLTLLNQKGLGRPMLDLYKTIIQRSTDLASLSALGGPVYACAYDIEAQCPVYFDLTKQPQELVPEIVLASCAVPHVFPPVDLQGRLYADGGVNDPLYPLANANNCPAVALSAADIDSMLILHLHESEPVDLSFFGDKPVVHVYPSQPLERVSGSGSFDMTQHTLTKRLALGYQDGLKALLPFTTL